MRYGDASSPVPPRVLDDTGQGHQDTGPVVVMLIQEGLSSQALTRRAKVARNLDVDFNRTGIFVPIVFVPTVHTTPTVPSPIPVSNDNVLSTEEDLLSNVILIPPFSHTHETDNLQTLPSFEISDTLRTRVNMFNVDFNGQCASSEDEDRQLNNIGGVGLQIGRHFLGQKDVRCIHCPALHWLDENLSHSFILNPQFGRCCFQGKIRLPTLDSLLNCKNCMMEIEYFQGYFKTTFENIMQPTHLEVLAFIWMIE
ncbi:hypothetical protein GIB67_015917 [Kingdonia uniflora]|uniref:Uncharacterized protein n=1 Tax=Kingdonia uniflora TaxID=39325 RepID=A0A7J7PCM6_9MAGN|nr:hypothetical protein GIB67_015917 [Kingdonia uniflora]